ncbi:helix-turn-helix domain-containing protein [Cytobacillus sp. FSL K6-0265]|uniref:helix-turn-helix domain-containing protein n=1 Tax=Cytobacillus sp. FSL K6-0265 TaxID=2921448 RepID=UPI0030FBEE63
MTKPSNFYVASNLKRILDEKEDMSIRQLAEKAELNFETVRRLYNDETRQYQRDSIAAVCVVLGIGIGDLLEIKERN